jgi:hypothetical protein
MARARRAVAKREVQTGGALRSGASRARERRRERGRSPARGARDLVASPRGGHRTASRRSPARGRALCRGRRLVRGPRRARSAARGGSGLREVQGRPPRAGGGRACPGRGGQDARSGERGARRAYPRRRSDRGRRAGRCPLAGRRRRRPACGRRRPGTRRPDRPPASLDGGRAHDARPRANRRRANRRRAPCDRSSERSPGSGGGQQSRSRTGARHRAFSRAWPLERSSEGLDPVCRRGGPERGRGRLPRRARLVACRSR